MTQLLFGDPVLHQSTPQCAPLPHRFNQFEQRSPEVYPRGDVMARVRRGAITPASQLGLRVSQRRAGDYGMYNGGCLDAHGCVPDAPGTGGFRCPLPAAQPPAELQHFYDWLNRPLAQDRFEYQPPAFMMRRAWEGTGPSSGPDSVLGWAADGDGVPRWEAEARRRAPSELC
jgi:hypothetical protein